MDTSTVSKTVMTVSDGVNEPYCEWPGPEKWVKPRKGKRKERGRLIFNTELYFCNRCIDACLFATTFARDGGDMPLCPLGREPNWIEIKHPWIAARVSHLITLLIDETVSDASDNMTDDASSEPDDIKDKFSAIMGD